MGVTLLPGAPQFGGGGAPNVDMSRVAELALQVRQQKMGEKQQEKQEALSRIQMLLGNPLLMSMQDPNKLDKDLKLIGIQVSDRPIAAPAPGQAPGQAPAAGGANVPQTTPPGLDPNAIASLAAATQGNQAGAAASSPPTVEAARRAPGGGMMESLMSPQNVQALTSRAVDGFNSNFGKLAPLYGQAASALELEQIKTHHMMEIMNLQSQAHNGDFQAMGRLAAMAGQHVTDSDTRNFIMSSNMDPRVIAKAMDVALGNETDGDKAKRFESTIKTLAGTPQFMDKLEDPTQLTEYARSVVYGSALPQLKMKPHTLAELNSEAEYEKLLITESGFPPDFAHKVARFRTNGLPYDMVVPPGFKTLAERKIGATEAQASASVLAAQAEAAKVKVDADKIAAELGSKKFDILNDRLRTMIEAKKQGIPWPQDLQDQILKEVAQGVGMSLERTYGVWDWWSGTLRGTAVAADDVARQAARGDVYLTPEQEETMRGLERTDAEREQDRADAERARIRQQSSHTVTPQSMRRPQPTAEELRAVGELIRRRRQ